MFHNWARRKKARQLLVINQTPVCVAAPGWCKNHLDGSLRDIDIEIGGLLQIEWVIFVILRAIPVFDGDAIADW